ncbi:MAG: hypothetical protein AB4372_37055 [Xenococcus sp. (in: cyanobacteria)]
MVRDSKSNWTLPIIGESPYKVYFKSPKKSDHKYLPSPGVDSHTIEELEGYLVEPMFFPIDFVLPERVRCELTTANGVTGGSFLLDIIPSGPADAIAGQKIRGTFSKKR